MTLCGVRADGCVWRVKVVANVLEYVDFAVQV